MSEIVGLVLAGGTGQRLGGVRKSDLRLANRPLALWIDKVLSSQCDSIITSAASKAGSSLRDIVTDDADGWKGPVAGLLAGARWCRANAPGALMVSVSVDTPFFPTDFVMRAQSRLSEKIGCVVAAFNARDYPTNALWHPDRLLELVVPMPSHPKGPSIRSVQAQLGTAQLDYGRINANNPFWGINSLADLLALSTRQKALARLSE